MGRTCSYNEDAQSTDEYPLTITKHKLQKHVGLVSSIAMMVGIVIGGGIFASPIGVLAQTQSVGASLLIWFTCGLYSLMGAYCYAELGVMMPQSGGDYSYILEAFGRFWGFLRLWIEIMVIRPSSIAATSTIFADYLVQPISPDCFQSDYARKLLAICCVLLVGFINCSSVKWSVRTQDLLTCTKVFALMLIIITGLVRISQGHTEAFENAFDGARLDPGTLTVAFYHGLFTYSGWNYLNCMIAEMRNPYRDLPIAVVVGCLIITALFTMANVAYLTVLTVPEMIESVAVANTFASRVFGRAWVIMPIFVALSTFSCINGTVMSTSRIFYVAGQEKQMPVLMMMLHTNRYTPIPAIAFTCFTTIVYIIVGNLNFFFVYLGFVQWLSIGASVGIVIIFRFTRPNIERPVKVPMIFAIIFVAVTLFLVIFAFFGSMFESLMGVGIILTGIPVYLLGCKWRKKPRFILHSMKGRPKIMTQSIKVSDIIHQCVVSHVGGSCTGTLLAKTNHNTQCMPGMYTSYEASIVYPYESISTHLIAFEQWDSAGDVKGDDYLDGGTPTMLRSISCVGDEKRSFHFSLLKNTNVSTTIFREVGIRTQDDYGMLHCSPPL